MSAWLLFNEHHHHGHDHHKHADQHDHEHHEHDHDDDHHCHEHSVRAAQGHHGGHDTNLRAAYMHVLADALTSALAIVALLSGWLFGWTALDPLMGVVGVLVIAHWSFGLLRTFGRGAPRRRAGPAPQSDAAPAPGG